MRPTGGLLQTQASVNDTGVRRRREGEEERGRPTHRLVVSPCAADRPARSCPLAGPLDCTLLLGSLKDQEENLIVVKTWT